jgi:hypothetical protein
MPLNHGIGSLMKNRISAIVAGCLLFSTCGFAASDNSSPLAPGGSAGVKQAQEFSVPIILSVVGVLGAGVAAAILVSNSGSHGTTNTPPSKQ